MKKIGITYSDTNFDNYPAWIKGSDADIEIIILSYKENNILDAENCDAFVFSGGIDIHPSYYRNPRLNFPNNEDGKFNLVRDAFEKKVFDIAQQKNASILGICRGMQLINCLLGGDLVQDLEEVGKKDHRSHNKVDGSHTIKINVESEFYKISGVLEGNINSAHHQSIGKIADGLEVIAESEDGVPEAIEYKNKINKTFFLCVQWHPERLTTEDKIPFSKNIRESFLKSIL